MIIESEAPGDDLWSYFHRFEVRDWITSRFQVAPEQADAVADCVRQAREYAVAARIASLRTRPVMAYYSMVSLAKVLLLLRPTSPIRMETIEGYERKGHGLREYDTQGQYERGRRGVSDEEQPSLPIVGETREND